MRQMIPCLIKRKGPNRLKLLLYGPEVLINHFKHEDVLLLGLSLAQSGCHRGARLQNLYACCRLLLQTRMSFTVLASWHVTEINPCYAQTSSVKEGRLLTVVALPLLVYGVEKQ